MSNNIDLYYKYQNQLQMADLIEFAASSALGHAIRFCTKMPVNHTAGILIKQLVGDTKERRYIGEAVSTGFEDHYLSHVIGHYKGKVYWVRLKPEYDEFRLAIAKRAQELEGVPYDYKSLFGNAFRRIPLDDSKGYCSEDWHIAYRDAGLIAKDFSPTGKPEHKGCGLRPGEFGRTGLFLDPVLIYSST
jgi:hypothetical protein